MAACRSLMRSMDGRVPLRGSGTMLQPRACGGMRVARILTRQAHQPPAATDGYRILIDRAWPRGMSRASIDAWAKDIAPSPELREWYGDDPAKWPEFRRRYVRELRAPAARALLDDLARRARRARVTLVHQSKPGENSEVALLVKLLDRRARLAAQWCDLE